MSKYVRMFAFLFFKAQNLLERSKTSVSQFGWRQIHKGKFYSRTGHDDPKREKYSSTLSLTSGLDGVAWSTPCPGQCTLGEQTLCPFYRRLCGPDLRPGRVRKFSPLLSDFRSVYFLSITRYPETANSFRLIVFLIFPRVNMT
jgi:hypothetical protein